MPEASVGPPLSEAGHPRRRGLSRSALVGGWSSVPEVRYSPPASSISRPLWSTGGSSSAGDAGHVLGRPRGEGGDGRHAGRRSPRESWDYSVMSANPKLFETENKKCETKEEGTLGKGTIIKSRGEQERTPRERAVLCTGKIVAAKGIKRPEDTLSEGGMVILGVASTSKENTKRKQMGQTAETEISREYPLTGTSWDISQLHAPVKTNSLVDLIQELMEYEEEGSVASTSQSLLGKRKKPILGEGHDDSFEGEGTVRNVKR